LENLVVVEISTGTNNQPPTTIHQHQPSTGANVQRRIVAARHSAFERTSRHLFGGGEDDEKLFAEIERKFQPMPLTISRGGPSRTRRRAEFRSSRCRKGRCSAVSPTGSDPDDTEIAVDAQSMSGIRKTHDFVPHLTNAGCRASCC
jgi:hypothetical protein